MTGSGGPYYYSGYDDLATRYRANQLLAAIAAAQNNRAGGSGSSILRDAIASDIMTVFNNSLPPHAAAYFPNPLNHGLFSPRNAAAARGEDLSPRSAAALYALQQQHQQHQQQGDILFAPGGGSIYSRGPAAQHPHQQASSSLTSGTTPHTHWWYSTHRNT